MSSSVNGSAQPSDFVVKLHEASRTAQFYMFPAIPASFLVIKVGQVAHAKLFERLNIQDMGRDDILRTSLILAAGSSLYFYWPPLLSLSEKIPFIKNWKKPPKPVEVDDKKPQADDKKSESSERKRSSHKRKENQEVQLIHPGHFMVTMLCRFAMLSIAFGSPVAIAQIEDRKYQLLTCGLAGVTHYAIYRMTGIEKKENSQTKPDARQSAPSSAEKK
ncbi:MAG: hypothetical protein LLG04_11575 [Parachlamydia sp.]|nr:hypothetical protein [Parachlamydia sp.]